jgi:hypothetical protein
MRIDDVSILTIIDQGPGGRACHAAVAGSLGVLAAPAWLPGLQTAAGTPARHDPPIHTSRSTVVPR